jgi:hypothetical protein
MTVVRRLPAQSSGMVRHYLFRPSRLIPSAAASFAAFHASRHAAGDYFFPGFAIAATGPTTAGIVLARWRIY